VREVTLAPGWELFPAMLDILSDVSAEWKYALLLDRPLVLA
jgi:hypothetical protein